MLNFFLNILGNALVKSVAGDRQAGGAHPPTHADHGDIRGAAADINHHAAHGLADIQPCAKGGGDRLIHKETCRAPAAMTASTTASASMPVMAAGTQTDTRGLMMRERHTSLINRTISSFVMRWS